MSLVTLKQACAKPGTTNTSDSCHMDNNYPYETYNQPWGT